jgi:hypothetical protein
VTSLETGPVLASSTFWNTSSDVIAESGGSRRLVLFAGKEEILNGAMRR